MAEIKIAIFNDSTALTDAQVAAIVPALQSQVSEHFAPVWGINADLLFVAKGQTPPAGYWWLTFFDDSDQAGALGYHDLTNEALPTGKVFAQTDLTNNLSWSVTASHELLEMLADPGINRTVFIQTGHATGTLYAYEVCDAVEDDQFGYEISGVLVSDFVLPAYFEPGIVGSAVDYKYDFGGHLIAPVPALLKGGYIGSFDVAGSQGWQQITAGSGISVHRGKLRSTLNGTRGHRRAHKGDSGPPSGPQFTGDNTRFVPMAEPRFVPMELEPRLAPM